MTAFGSVRRTFRLAAAATLVASLSAGPARAQMAEDPDPAGRIDVSVAVGLLTPLSNLTENASSFGTVIDPYVSFGADATLWTSRRFGVGVFAPSQLSAIGTQFQGAIPSDLGDATYLAAALNAVYRFPVSGSAAVIEPYVAGGAGIRYLSVDAIAGPEVDSTTDPAATLAELA